MIRATPRMEPRLPLETTNEPVDSPPMGSSPVHNPTATAKSPSYNSATTNLTDLPLDGYIKTANLQPDGYINIIELHLNDHKARRLTAQ